MRRERWWREPAQYYIIRDKIIRRPHEEFKPIDLNSPIAKTDFAKLEQALWEKIRGTR